MNYVDIWDEDIYRRVVATTFQIIATVLVRE